MSKGHTLADMLCLAALAGALGLGAAAAAQPEASPRLGKVRSWGYQLQNIKLQDLARAGCDLLVVDYAHDGRPMKPRDLDAVRAGRSPAPILLAYISIGEAENYRFYWHRDWTLPWSRPGWLGRENPEWRGNFSVQYWDPEWQDIFLREDGYLARIAAAGFDGIYLDRVDAFSPLQKRRPEAAQEMIDFVTRIAGRSRQLVPGFIVVAQNGEELLRSSSYRSQIDAIAKEDLFFGADEDGEQNSEAQVASSLRDLQNARTAGLPVFLVEYLDDGPSRDPVLRKGRELGFVTLIADRSLGRSPSCR